MIRCARRGYSLVQPELRCFNLWVIPLSVVYSLISFVWAKTTRASLGCQALQSVSCLHLELCPSCRCAHLSLPTEADTSIRPKQACLSFTCARRNLPNSALRITFVAGRGGFRAPEIPSCKCRTPEECSCPTSQDASRPGTLQWQHASSGCLQTDRKPACLCCKPIACLFFKTSLL